MGKLNSSSVFAGALVLILILIFAASCNSRSSSPSGPRTGESALETAQTETPAFLPGFPAGLGEGQSNVIEPPPESLVEIPDSAIGARLVVVESGGAITADCLSVSETRTPSGFTVEIAAVGAPSCIQALFELYFDASRFKMTGWRMGGFFTDGKAADGGGESLEAANSSIQMRGGALGTAITAQDHVAVAAARMRPDVGGEARGSGVICTLEFAHGATKLDATPAPADAGRGASAETGGGFWDWEYGTIMPAGTAEFPCATAFYFAKMPGDTNLDNRVTVSDISSIAAFYQDTVTWIKPRLTFEPGGDPENRRIAKSDADLNFDGVVDIKDITIIAMNYGRKYYPNHLAARPIGGGDWQPLFPLSNTKPEHVVFYPEYSVKFARWIDVELEPESYEYGITFVDGWTGEFSAFPLVYHEFDGLVWDKYFGKIETREYTDSENSEWYLVIEFDLFGDYSGDGWVLYDDISSLALTWPYVINNLFPVALEHLHPFHFQLMDGYWSTSILMTFLYPIMMNAGLIGPARFDIAYFDGADALTPVWTEESYTDALNDYWQYGDFWEDRVSRFNTPTHSIPAPPLSGTLYAEVTAYMRLDNSHPLVPVKYPTRVELYFPPVTGEEEGL